MNDNCSRCVNYIFLQLSFDIKTYQNHRLERLVRDKHLKSDQSNVFSGSGTFQGPGSNPKTVF